MCWGRPQNPLSYSSHTLGLGQESMDFDQIFSILLNFGSSSNSHTRCNDFRSVLFAKYISKLTPVRGASPKNENLGSTSPKCVGETQNPLSSRDEALDLGLEFE